MIEAANKTKLAVCLSDGTVIKGTLNIHKYNRLSDFLNSKEADPFLIIYDAVMPGATSKVAIINREHIVWATPEG
jgi:hypothetical protein